MRSKGVTVRLASAEEVQASVHTFGNKVVGLLDERLESPGEGIASFTYQPVFDHLYGDLEEVLLGLVEAEDAHVRQQIVISNLQRESDRLKTELYDQQVAIRQTFAGLFGSEHENELAAISGRTPRGRKDLEEQVDQTIKLLRDPAVEVPELKIRQGVEINFGALAEGLEAGKVELHAARSGLLRARKGAVQTMLVKHAAITEFNRIFPATAGILEGFFRLVGEVELADRIRTSIRRVTNREGAEDDEAPAEDPQSTEGESGDTELAAAMPESTPSISSDAVSGNTAFGESAPEADSAATPAEPSHPEAATLPDST